MKKTYLKPSIKRMDITVSESLMDLSMQVHTKETEDEVNKIDDLLGNSTNVWEED